MSTFIRDANIDDVEGIAQVALDAWNFAYSSFLPPEFMAQRSNPVRRAQRMRENWRNDVNQIVAVTRTGTIAGFAFEHRPCTLDGFDAEVGALYVDPASSRAGVGKSLVVELVGRFVRHGFNSMAIHTLAENAIGCAFYQKLGGQDGPLTTWHDFPSRWFVWPDLQTTFGDALRAEYK